MLNLLITALLWFSALGCGIMAGVYFTFSAFAMTAFDRLGALQGAGAMNAINTTILQSWFMPFFFGTTLASAALAGIAIVRWNEPGATVMLAGGLLYVVGMFVVTIVFNVPFNNALAEAGQPGADATALWERYLREWTAWNHVRTVASTAGAALFIAALVSRGH